MKGGGGATPAAVAREIGMPMKRKLIRLSGRYRAALRTHLKQGPAGSLLPARELGRQAVVIGLETLDMARIHEGALATLEASSSRDGIIERAEIFFAEAITPIEKTHHAALKTNARLSELNKTLGRRTADLATSNRSLKEGIARRKTVEKALRKSGEHSKKLLEESGRLQKHLQRLAHRIMAAEEDKRKQMSHDLRDEIAQTLLGINVRLLTLKMDATANTEGFKKDIASTQRLVEESIESINRFARELDIHQHA
jgi:signal transduction histidine kinase